MVEMASERERYDKPKSSSVKHIPKDAQVIMSIMKELDVTEYELRVINQLLEFTYRYVTCILDDAKIYANHAKKKVIELDDVKLASQMTLEKSFTTPPPREVLLELARNKNIAPLPIIKTHCGLRLPPERHCLLSVNYKLRAAELFQKKIKKSALQRSINKNRSSGSAHLKRQSLANLYKSQKVLIPKPMFKVNTNGANGGSSSGQPTMSIIPNYPLKLCPKIKVELEEEFSEVRGMKRRYEQELQEDEEQEEEEELEYEEDFEMV